ncbi:MAG: carbohydrate ABC transporter permease [Aristaeellaceae bacterium]
MKNKLVKGLRQLTAGRIIYFLLAAVWFFITLFPLYFTVVSSLKPDSEIWGTMFAPPVKPQWQNYTDVLSNANLFRSIANSLILALGSVAIMIVCVVMSSYVIARRHIRVANAVKMYLSAALMIPLQGAVVPIVQMVGYIGGKNNFLVLMLIYVGLNISMSSFILTGYISGIEREIDESAAMDGCNLFQIVYRIIFPIAMPGVATAAIVGFLNVYNELAIANVVMTKSKYLTVSAVLLNFKGDYQVELRLIFASIVIVIIPILVFYLLCQEKVEHGLAAGAVKG